MELDSLRNEIKELKLKKGFNYTFFSNEIGMTASGFRNFMAKCKGLSEEKQQALKTLIGRFK